jgi:hypothetical protein
MRMVVGTLLFFITILTAIFIFICLIIEKLVIQVKLHGYMMFAFHFFFFLVLSRFRQYTWERMDLGRSHCCGG